MAIVAALGIGALRLLMAIVQTQSTLVDIWTLGVRPLRIVMRGTI